MEEYGSLLHWIKNIACKCHAILLSKINYILIVCASFVLLRLFRCCTSKSVNFNVSKNCRSSFIIRYAVLGPHNLPYTHYRALNFEVRPYRRQTCGFNTQTLPKRSFNWDINHLGCVHDNFGNSPILYQTKIQSVIAKCKLFCFLSVKITTFWNVFGMNK